jgi:hypothetical protein
MIQEHKQKVHRVNFDILMFHQLVHLRISEYFLYRVKVELKYFENRKIAVCITANKKIEAIVLLQFLFRRYIT